MRQSETPPQQDAQELAGQLGLQQWRQAWLQRGRDSEPSKSSEDEEPKASRRGEGGRTAQTQRAANGKGHTDAGARVLGQNLRAGGEGPRIESKFGEAGRAATLCPRATGSH